jgi:Fe-S-cluster-containing dehydrogenase component/DMSO reductase anchor subunit
MMNANAANESARAVPRSGPARTLIDALLAEQCELTAVEEFARAHEHDETHGSRYRGLIPASAPGSGQQYAFEVDLDQCSGCKACVTACHALNGLDEDETWRSVGRLASTDWRSPLQQVVTTSCHHCVDPACLNGCPVLAYDKDPVTGIVRHLDDQCIGCQYCVMMCPYDVPQYSEARSIVRKCDMCSSRLSAGEAPACVQACPNEAIRITVVEPAKVRGRYRALPAFDGIGARQRVHSPNAFLPDSPNPAITLPTTRYVSRRTLPAELKGVDSHQIRPAKAHPSLTFMLVLSQGGAGLAVMNALTGGGSRGMVAVAIAMTLLGVGIGTLHLGQPLKAWRSFLGWRRSWLSRELIVFGAFLGTLGVHLFIGNALTAIPAAVTGLLAVACSAMVYINTRRPFWNARMTFGRFLGTTFLLGSAGALLLSSFDAAPILQRSLLFAFVMLGVAFKLAVEQRVFRHLANEQDPHLTALNKTALLLNGSFGRWSRVRVMCAIVGGVVLPLMMLAGVPMPGLAVFAFGFCLVGELIERHLFFVAEVAPKMPGVNGV